MLPGSDTFAALIALAVARLGKVAGQLPTAVAACTSAANDAPCASVPMLGQLNACVAPLPVIVQPAVPVAQVSAAPLGSGSVKVTPFAGPGPLFVSFPSRRSSDLAVTVPPSGVLAITST